MFTGLVQDVGVIKSIDAHDGGCRIEVGVSLDVTSVQMGASVACSGVCLTVVEKSNSSLFFDVSAETLSRSIIGSWSVSDAINVEPSLKLGDEMGGHIVSGHVDAVTKIIDVTSDGESYRFKIAIPHGYEAYIASKGSVTLDGISLTVNEVDDHSFGVNIIPHTWENTTLQYRKAGDDINLEIDTLARYVARMLEVRDKK